jgi:Fe-S-cluster containining protein
LFWQELAGGHGSGTTDWNPGGCMTLKDKKKQLKKIYEDFEVKAHPFKRDAICQVGCAYCCTDVGNVDTVTLEGLIIWERLNTLPRLLRSRIQKKIVQNRRERELAKIVRCPFLKEDDTCLVYDIRPFSCRQLYSLKECRGRGSTVHRQAVEIAKAAVRDLQRLDDTGYSGHLSFILHLFDRDYFKKIYLSGGFDPGKIASFGKSHGLIINRSTM